ncbi:MAG: HAMP domain-containing protein, partial [Pirellulaceae bacterium]|nr:HAMP domain-containing protein [Pirellulaceae bacterium]
MRFSLFAKLVLFVAVVVIVTATITNWLGFSFARKSLTTQIQQRLRTVAHDREARLDAYVSQQKERALLVASRTRLRKYLADRIDGRESEDAFRTGAERILRDALTSIDEFTAIWVTSPDGRVVASTDAKLLGRDYSQHPDYQEGKRYPHLGMPTESGEGFESLLTAPAKTNEGRFLGVVMIQLKLKRLVQLLDDSSGMGRTGEVLVATRREDDLIYLIPPGNSVSGIRTLAAETAPAMVRAIDGDSGQGTDVYDGKEVLVAWQDVAFQNRDFAPWGMVVKIDADEAFAPITDLQRLQWAMELFLVLLGAVLSYVLAKRFLRPISAMADTADKIAQGDRFARVAVNSRDEFGQLGESFNKMTSQLLQAQMNLESRVVERTKELAAAN